MSDNESEREEQQPPAKEPIEPPQSAHFLEAHVIFEPLLSAIGVITQQVPFLIAAISIQVDYQYAFSDIYVNIKMHNSIERLRKKYSKSFN